MFLPNVRHQTPHEDWYRRKTFQTFGVWKKYKHVNELIPFHTCFKCVMLTQYFIEKVVRELRMSPFRGERVKCIALQKWHFWELSCLLSLIWFIKIRLSSSMKKKEIISTEHLYSNDFQQKSHAKLFKFEISTTCFSHKASFVNHKRRNTDENHSKCKVSENVFNKQY